MLIFAFIALVAEPNQMIEITEVTTLNMGSVIDGSESAGIKGG